MFLPSRKVKVIERNKNIQNILLFGFGQDINPDYRTSAFSKDGIQGPPVKSQIL